MPRCIVTPLTFTSFTAQHWISCLRCLLLKPGPQILYILVFALATIKHYITCWIFFLSGLGLRLLFNSVSIIHSKCADILFSLDQTTFWDNSVYVLNRDWIKQSIQFQRYDINKYRNIHSNMMYKSQTWLELWKWKDKLVFERLAINGMNGENLPWLHCRHNMRWRTQRLNYCRSFMSYLQ